MARVKATYGRRPNRQAALAVQCFAQSSSPARPDDKEGLCTVVAQDIPKIHDEPDLESLLSGVKKLEISDSDESPIAPSRRPRQRQSRRAPLKERDANAEATSSPVRADKVSVTDQVREKVSTPHSRRLSGIRNRRQRASQSPLDTPVSSQVQPRSPAESVLKSIRSKLGSPDLSTPLRTRQHRNKPIPSIPSPCCETLISHTKPLLDLCTDDASRFSPIDFSAWSTSLSQYFHITKLAEASYGEVYRLSLHQPNPSFSRSDESVIKIIALQPPPSLIPSLTKAQQSRIAGMSAVSAVASEVRLLKHMSPVPGFTRFRDCRVVRGRLPPEFIAAWREFNKVKGKKSEFPDPGRKATYSEDQLWAVVEMQDAGQDLENILLKDVWGAWDAFWGVAIALAKGEEWAEFEHRDLHLGNVCVKGVDTTGRCDTDPVLQRLRKGAGCGFTGLETTIIDYTLSRARVHTEASKEIGPNGDVAFLDLASDPAIFQGDGEEDYQYDIYRHMHSAVRCGDPVAEYSEPKPTKKRGKGRSAKTKNAEEEQPRQMWRDYCPLTNVVWLHFVLFKLCESVEWPSDKKGTPLDEDGILLQDKARELEERLGMLEQLLDLGSMKTSEIGSAGGLVAWALENGWLYEEEVVNYGINLGQ